MLWTLDKKLQEHYDGYRNAIGTAEDYKKFSRLPGEMIERLEANFIDAYVKKGRKLARGIGTKARTVTFWRIISWIGMGFILAFLLGILLRSLDSLFYVWQLY